jgi:hypothetical protein
VRSFFNPGVWLQTQPAYGDLAIDKAFVGSNNDDQPKFLISPDPSRKYRFSTPIQLQCATSSLSEVSYSDDPALAIQRWNEQQLFICSYRR